MAESQRFTYTPSEETQVYRGLHNKTGTSLVGLGSHWSTDEHIAQGFSKIRKLKWNGTRTAPEDLDRVVLSGQVHPKDAFDPKNDVDYDTMQRLEVMPQSVENEVTVKPFGAINNLSMIQYQGDKVIGGKFLGRGLA